MVLENKRGVKWREDFCPHAIFLLINESFRGMMVIEDDERKYKVGKDSTYSFGWSHSNSR